MTPLKRRGQENARHGCQGLDLASLELAVNGVASSNKGALTLELVEHFGISLKLDPSYMSDYMMEVIRQKRYEIQEARQLKRIIQPNEVVLEIGAGIGFMASLIANNALTTRVVSYEANGSLVPRITETVKNNTGENFAKWEIRHAVLATGYRDQNEMDFYVHKDFWASSLTPSADAIRVEKVKVDSFNSVIAEVKPTLIVCDIEGGELELFKNADLSGVKKVYLEVHQKRLGRRGIRALFECFHSRDFSYDQHHSEGSVVLFSHVDRDKK